MVREIAIFLYLRFFSILFLTLNLLPLKRKVVFVVSFAENNENIYKEMRQQDLACETVFLTNKRDFSRFAKYKEASVLVLDIRHFPQFLKSIYHLATAKVVFVDNYYGFLASARFKKGVKCIQLWHANGAIKKFGLKDQTTTNRSLQANKRFQKVYAKFDHVIVGSEAMGKIFQQAFGLEENRILRTGIPRTDVFFNEDEQKKAKNKLYETYPQLSSKKVILYAPTYRDEQTDTFEIRLNLERLKNELENDYILLLRLHPAIKNSLVLHGDLNGFVLDVSDYPNLNELLFITEILISDYSSIPFEFSILNKPMIFFPYDLTDYEKTRGLWENYQEMVPGPTVFSTSEIIRTIKTNEFEYERLMAFNHKWNEFSTGNSSTNIVSFTKGLLGIEIHENVNVQSNLSH